MQVRVGSDAFRTWYRRTTNKRLELTSFKKDLWLSY